MCLYIWSRRPTGEVHTRHAGTPAQTGDRADGLRRPEDHLHRVQGIRARQGRNQPGPLRPQHGTELGRRGEHREQLDVPVRCRHRGPRTSRGAGGDQAMPEGGYYRPYGDWRQREHGQVDSDEVRHRQAERRLPHSRGQGVQQADQGQQRRGAATSAGQSMA